MGNKSKIQNLRSKIQNKFPYYNPTSQAACLAGKTGAWEGVCSIVNGQHAIVNGQWSINLNSKI